MIYESVARDSALTVENDPQGRGVALVVAAAPGRQFPPQGGAVILEPRDVVRVAVELLGKAGKEITLEVLEALKKT